MKMNFVSLKAMGVVVSAIILSGCTTNNRYERTTGQFMDDKRLAQRVKHALNAQPVYKFPDVKVQTFRGAVQLSGFVATDSQKEAAAEIASKVRGVENLENNILLAPLDQETVRDFIPGRSTPGERARGTNDLDRSVGGTPDRSGTTTGSTGSPTR